MIAYFEMLHIKNLEKNFFEINQRRVTFGCDYFCLDNFDNNFNSLLVKPSKTLYLIVIISNSYKLIDSIKIINNK